MVTNLAYVLRILLIFLYRYTDHALYIVKDLSKLVMNSKNAHADAQDVYVTILLKPF